MLHLENELLQPNNHFESLCIFNGLIGDVLGTTYVCFPHICTAQQLNIIKFFYSPTDALLSCLKKTILKCTSKFTLKQLRHVSVLQLHHRQGLWTILSTVTLVSTN